MGVAPFVLICLCEYCFLLWVPSPIHIFIIIYQRMFVKKKFPFGLVKHHYTERKWKVQINI